MTIILFIVVVILLLWVGSLSSRLDKLEKQQAYGRKQPREPETAGALASLTPEDYNRIEAHKTVSPEMHTHLHSVDPAPTYQPIMPAGQEHAPQAPRQPTIPATPKQPISPYGWLTKFGVLAIALGIVFFFKYAIDQGWISEWMRVLFGLVVGALFVYLGELWKNKYEKYSFALSGGGILILDFTIYAAFNFYHLLPQPIALGLMVIVSGLAVWLSVQRKSLTLAALGIIGAYGAPLLLPTGQNQQSMLFSYLMILSLAVVAVLWRRFWVELAFLGLVAAIFDFGVWAANYSSASNTWSSVVFVVLLGILFVPLLAGFFRKHHAANTLTRNAEKNFAGLSALAGLFYFISIDGLLNVHFYPYLPLLILLGAVVWWVAYLLVDRLNYKTLNYFLSFMGTAFVVAAAYWQFSGRTFDAVLVAIALVSVIIGYFVKRGEFNTWGHIVLYVSLLLVTFEPYHAADSQFLLNGKFALMLLETAALVFTGWLSSKSVLSEADRRVQHLSEVVAALLLWVAVSWDISHAFSGLGSSQGMSLWWVIYPPVLAWLAYMGKRGVLSVIALCLLFLAAINAFVLSYAPGPQVFLLNAKFGLMLLETLGFLAVAYIQMRQSEGGAKTSRLLEIFAAIYLWIAVTWDIGNAYQGIGASEGMALWWVLYAPVIAFLARVGKRKGLAIVSLVFLAIGALEVLFLPYDWWSYVFLANAKFGLMVLQTATLLAIAFLREEESGSADKVAVPDILKVAASLYLWFGVSWEIVQYYSLGGSENIRNLLLSVWWIIYGAILMVVSAIRGFALYRKVAMLFFGLAIAKVFLYDVAALDTGYRIVSFIVLGVILLSVSFAYQKNKEKITEFLVGEKKDKAIPNA